MASAKRMKQIITYIGDHAMLLGHYVIKPGETTDLLSVAEAEAHPLFTVADAHEDDKATKDTTETKETKKEAS